MKTVLSATTIDTGKSAYRYQPQADALWGSIWRAVRLKGIPHKIAARQSDVLFGLDKKCLLITPLRRSQLDGYRALAQRSRFYEHFQVRAIHVSLRSGSFSAYGYRGVRRPPLHRECIHLQANFTIRVHRIGSDWFQVPAVAQAFDCDQNGVRRLGRWRRESLRCGWMESGGTRMHECKREQNAGSDADGPPGPGCAMKHAIAAWRHQGCLRGACMMQLFRDSYTAKKLWRGVDPCRYLRGLF
jgi:hypothetical protein